MNEQPQLQIVEGTLERITFQNEENGYTIAKLIPQGRSSEVTLVGAISGVNVGERLRVQGVWTTHPKYGRQFEVRSYIVRLPATVEGIRKYLGSGLIHGIGPVNAKRIVDYFGTQTLDVIETQVARLREVPGIGPQRTARIAEAWEEQKLIKEIMLFLQSQDVSASLAVKIYKQYGDASIETVRQDPYRLAKDIYGIGFKTADRIAQRMGFAHDAPERVRAGLRYVLGTFSDEGHVYAERRALVGRAAELLEVPVELGQAELSFLVRSEEVWEEPLGPQPGEGQAESTAIYLLPFYYAEVGVAKRIAQLRAYPRDRLAGFAELNWDAAFGWLDARNPFRLAPAQRDAVQMALTHKVSILTGGPGTGKSTITGSIIQLLQTKHRSVLLAAPTGRAAKRLSQATGLEAKTIHRLLEYKPAFGNVFLKDQDNPLDADMVIVDETSMVDLLLMNHLLKAIEAGSHLLLVGDVDQLPSVGAGNVLRNLIDSGVIPVTRLNTIYRQAEDSFIIVNAHRINQGELPLLPKESRDFFLFRQAEPQAAAELTVDLVSRRIPDKFGFDPLHDIQVLTPMHRGAAGVSALNERLQAVLNPPSPQRLQLTHGSRVFRVGDRVMQIRNDYDRQVFNGDMGEIIAIDLEEHVVMVDFLGQTVGYEVVQLDELVHAYAVSIHKSQGSEFPAVVVPLLTQHYMMLQRNLLYTAVTRARQLVVIVGSDQAIAIAVHNAKIAQRNSRLTERLRAAQGEKPLTGSYG